MSELIPLDLKILSENDKLAAQIRKRLNDKKILTLNLVSSPGSGKTSLLEQTLKALNNDLRIAIIAGDVQTENDANRLKKAGGKIVRAIVTGSACHLDASMILKALRDMELEKMDLLFIENVGNLVCPSNYDLGEDQKVVLISVTEGDDKPSKYPSMFRRSSTMIINKTDLIPYCEFSIESVRKNALNINANLNIISLSCRTGDGLDTWYSWLKSAIELKKRSI